MSRDKRNPDHVVFDLSDGFQICRDRDRPIIVELDNGKPHQYLLYPSGRALRALDGHNPFQEYKD